MAFATLSADLSLIGTASTYLVFKIICGGQDVSVATAGHSVSINEIHPNQVPNFGNYFDGM